MREHRKRLRSVIPKSSIVIPKPISVIPNLKPVIPSPLPNCPDGRYRETEAKLSKVGLKLDKNRILDAPQTTISPLKRETRGKLPEQPRAVRFGAADNSTAQDIIPVIQVDADGNPIW